VAALFPGFELERVDVGEATLRVRHGGGGPPLLLLYGHPQESSKPASTPDHEPYSKRAVARDQVELMRQLGFERFSFCGHDRGARWTAATSSPRRRWPGLLLFFGAP
jgi:haloacetate dehalogenase